MFPILHLYYTSIYMVKLKLKFGSLCIWIYMQNWEQNAKLYKNIVMSMCSISARLCGTFLCYCTTMAELPRCRPPTIGQHKAAAPVQEVRRRKNYAQKLEIVEMIDKDEIFLYMV